DSRMSVDVIERPTGVRVDEGHDEREYEPMCRGVLSHLHMSPAIDPKACLRHAQFWTNRVPELRNVLQPIHTRMSRSVDERQGSLVTSPGREALEWDCRWYAPVLSQIGRREDEQIAPGDVTELVNRNGLTAAFSIQT